MQVHDLSFWEKDTFLSAVDVLIIGSGIVGLNAAIALKKLRPHYKVLVLERGILPYGASTRNAGFACFGSISELISDFENQSENAVFELVEKRWKGLLQLRALLGDEAIGFEQWGGYEVFTEMDTPLFEKCEAKIALFNQNLHAITGQHNVYSEQTKASKEMGLGRVRNVIYNKMEGQIDTGKMMYALMTKARACGVEILTNINVVSWEENANQVTVHCDNGWQIVCANVISATNGFTQKLIPALEVTPARNQVLITQPIESLKIKGTFHYQEGYFYFRNVGNRILLGGGRHLDKQGEATSEMGQTKIIQDALMEVLTTIILPNQNFEIETIWSGIMGIGEVKSPIISAISPRIFVAVRMGGMGVAIGTNVGIEVANLLINN